MCTFFARCAALAVLLAGCSRHGGAPAPSVSAPAPRVDTLRLTLPVIRLTPADSASGSATIDSATIHLLERRIMSRLSSMLRAEAQIAAGERSAGIPPVKYAAPDIRHGLLGTIYFSQDGAVAETSRERIQAVAKLLDEVDGPFEVRGAADLATPGNIDIALARARRVYLDLIAFNRSLAERDVAIVVTGVATLQPFSPVVEIYWRPAAEPDSTPRQ
jgi:hypothetical protein